MVRADSFGAAVATMLCASTAVANRQECSTSVKALHASPHSIWRSCCLVGFPWDTDYSQVHVKCTSIYCLEVRTSECTFEIFGGLEGMESGYDAK